MTTRWRWALLKLYDIPDRNDPSIVYLRRLRVVMTPWFGVFVHWLLRPDSDRDVHDHPWRFWSIILRGGYEELFVPVAHDHHWAKFQRWRRWSVHRMEIESAHKIIDVEPRTVSLVLIGKRVRSWGFWTTAGDFVPHRQYDAGSGPDPFDS